MAAARRQPAPTRRSASGAPEPLGPPKPKESIDQAPTRINETLGSGDCDRIAKLNPLSRTTLDNPKRCAALKRLASRKATGATAYPGGGILDYAVGPRTLAAILVVDADGLYHIALLDPFVGKPSAGTPFAPQFDAAARKVATALTRRDCQRLPGGRLPPDRARYAQPQAALPASERTRSR